MTSSPSQISGSDLYWRWIPGYEGIYQVSVFGSVRSVDRLLRKSTGEVQHRHGKLLSLIPSGGGADGYLCARLSKDGHAVTRTVHTLVLEAFTGRRTDGQQGRHLDGNHMDNRLPKLAWGTPSENARDTLRCGNGRWQRAISSQKEEVT